MESDTVKIEKLKGIENWSVWKLQVRVMFISHEVLSVVDGTEPRPQAPESAATDANAATVAAYNTSKENYDRDIEEFIKRDGIAQKFIVTTVGRQSIMYIQNCSSSKEM